MYALAVAATTPGLAAETNPSTLRSAVVAAIEITFLQSVESWPTVVVCKAAKLRLDAPTLFHVAMAASTAATGVLPVAITGDCVPASVLVAPAATCVLM